MTDLLTNVVSFMIYLLLLAQVGPWVAALCIVLSTVGYFAGERLRSWRYRHREEEGELEHKLTYMTHRSHDVTLAKDIRIFGLAPGSTNCMTSTHACTRTSIPKARCATCGRTCWTWLWPLGATARPTAC